MEVRLEGEGLLDFRGDEGMSTIICSCGMEFHSQANRNTYYGFKEHRKRNPDHYEVLRFTFRDPRKIEVINNSEGRYVPTPDDLARAMAYLYSRNGVDLKADDLRDTAVQIMQFFGFEREVVGNHLEHDEIAMMYQLEDLGLVDTRVEEYNLQDGSSWRVNYFVLNARKIREYSSRNSEYNEAPNVYAGLPEEVWVR